MPAGCEFGCINEKCEHYNKGFNITGPWPISRIELVISNLNMNNSIHAREKNRLVEMKDSGVEYVCTILPNETDVPICGYRVQLWSPNAKCIWNYDVIPSENETPKEALDKWQKPDKCKTSGGPLLTFSEVTEQGILCPHCGIKMNQDRWFSNET